MAAVEVTKKLNLKKKKKSKKHHLPLICLEVMTEETTKHIENNIYNKRISCIKCQESQFLRILRKRGIESELLEHRYIHTVLAFTCDAFFSSCASSVHRNDVRLSSLQSCA